MNRTEILLGCVLAMAATSATTPYWQARSGDFAARWTAADITGQAVRGGMPFSVRAYLSWLHRSEWPSPASGLTIEHRLRPVSLTGRYLSIRDESFVSQKQAAHPGGETRFRTFDLSAHGAARYRLVALDAIVPEVRIAQALATDPFVRAHAAGPVGSTVESVAEALRRGQGTNDACYEVPDDLMTRFAIVRGEAKGAIAVQIGLPGSGPCRYALTRIGLVLRPAAPIGPLVAAPTDRKPTLIDVR